MGKLLRYVCDEGGFNEVFITGSGKNGWYYQPANCATCTKVFQLATPASDRTDEPTEFEYRRFAYDYSQAFPYVTELVCPECESVLELMSIKPDDVFSCVRCEGGLLGVVPEGTWE